MKFKNIKAFEDFHSTEENEMDKMFAHESEEENSEKREEEENSDEAVEDERTWGDEGTKLERFSTFNEKKKAPKKDDKKEETPKRDFKDFDKDGDEEEPMTKALKDKEKKEKKEEKGGKKFEKPKKGEIPAALAAYQKKKNK